MQLFLLWFTQLARLSINKSLQQSFELQAPTLQRLAFSLASKGRSPRLLSGSGSTGFLCSSKFMRLTNEIESSNYCLINIITSFIFHIILGAQPCIEPG